jgi:hypothetical protein
LPTPLRPNDRSDRQLELLQIVLQLLARLEAAAGRSVCRMA